VSTDINENPINVLKPDERRFLDANEKNILRHMRTCVHRAAMAGPMKSNTCAAGLPMRQGRMDDEPCWNVEHADDCPSSLYMSRAEAEADALRAHDGVKRINKARAAIVEYTGGQRGTRGHIDCPVCGCGTLSFAVADSNGHIHAACTGRDCVRWME